MKKIIILLLFVFAVLFIYADWVNVGVKGELINYTQTRQSEISLEFCLDY